MKTITSKEVTAAMIANLTKLKSKLLERVRCRGATECWPFRGHDCNGYRVIRIGRYSDRVYRFQAHRVAFLVAHGAIDGDLLVLHSCDNRSCCNPAHLRQGTIADNMRDALLRGRKAKGSRHGMAKLTEKQVLEIRERVKTGLEFDSAIGRDYGVIGSVVTKIGRREIWTHI